MNSLKLAFFHDHKFLEKNNEVYSTGGLPASTWKRFLKHNNQISITAVGRDGKSGAAGDPKMLTPSNNDKVNFELIDNFDSVFERIKNYLSVKKKISSIVKAHDAIIVRLPSIFGNIAAFYAEKYDKPLGAEVVDCIWDGLKNSDNLVKRFTAPYHYYRMRNSVNSASHLIYVTEFFLQRRYPPSKKSISNNASNVNISKVGRSVLNNRLVKIENRSINDEYHVGMIAALNNENKGIDDAIISIKKLNQRGVDIYLHLLGAGNKSKWENFAYDHHIRKKIIFDGSLPSGEPVFNWLDNLDLYIHPSYKEGLPRSIIEAMSRGCPVIASNVAGIPELLPKELLHKPGSIKKMSNLIYGLFQNNKKNILLAERNFETAKKYYRENIKKEREKVWSNFIFSI